MIVAIYAMLSVLVVDNPSFAKFEDAKAKFVEFCCGRRFLITKK